MKIIVAIIVYNRVHNIEKWMHAWTYCDHDAQLVVIDNSSSEKIRELCDPSRIIYIPRQNIGFDIGAFQDVCRKRLKGFPEYDLLLWCTDDTFPMRVDFVRQY